MTRRHDGNCDDDRRLDPFLRELLEDEHDVALLSEALAAGVTEPVSPSQRARLLAEATHEGRLARFAEPVAALLDLSLERARALLDRLDDPRAWTTTAPGVALCWVEGGPRVRDALRGFVRLRAGVREPEHEHLGDETMFVLQGAFRDVVTGVITRAGERVQNPPGSRHAVEALSGGTDVLHLAIVQEGVCIDGQRFFPPKPSP